MAVRARLLLVSGSTRPGSSNGAALAAVAALGAAGPDVDRYDRLTDLPAFVPDADPVPEPVADLLARVARADAVLFSTPEYAGGLPGSLKNLLDWTVGGGELYGKPVAWLDVANPGRGAGARAQLATVLGYVGARIVEDACIHLPVRRVDGAAAVEPGALPELGRALTALAGAARPIG